MILDEGRLREQVSDARRLDAAFWAGLEPDPILSVAEWAAEHRVLSQSTSGEPGPWRNERTPYLVEIMESLSPSSPIRTVVFQAGSQLGKTEVGNNLLGYVVDQAPGPTLMVLPTQGVAENISKERLAPLFTESATLRGKVKDSRKKGSNNTLLRKEFPGGFVKLVSADSAAQLRSTPARYVIGDEVDAYPQNTGEEGDPCKLAVRAQITFRRRKTFWISTPKIRGTSKIEKLFLATDQRHYLVPCPHCGFEQRLVWDRMRFDSKATGAALKESVAYECGECRVLIFEHEKEDMIAKGRWEATAESEDELTRGYHLSALYSPWFTWFDLAQEWIAAQGDPAALQVFINLKLGETWEERGEKPDWHRLYERREHYPARTAPMGVTVITAGVDVQGDRLEYEIVGWGARHESWGIEYGVLPGDPSGDAVWRELWERLETPVAHESGESLPVLRIAVDSGYATTEVYRRCRGRSSVLIIKGEKTTHQPIRPPVQATAKTARGRMAAPVWGVGTDLLKAELYTWLRQDAPVGDDPAPRGFCHWHDEYPAAYFHQITAEEIVQRETRTGYTVREWKKTGERNEALDLRVYARAAVAQIGVDRWDPERWDLERERSGLPAVRSPEEPRPRPKTPRPRRSRGKSGRWDRFRK